MFILLLWTQPKPNWSFFIFVFICLVSGFALEWTGVNTGKLFGDYAYGSVLGYRWQGVPLLIGVNWFIMMYCCGITVYTVLRRFAVSMAGVSNTPPKVVRALSVIVDGATLAVFFDWVMEPVAVRLGFWQWFGNGQIPFYNYFCWFLASMLLLALFHFLPFPKSNKFAIHLLLIQLMFFLLLRTLYN